MASEQGIVLSELHMYMHQKWMWFIDTSFRVKFFIRSTFMLCTIWCISMELLYICPFCANFKQMKTQNLYFDAN